MQKTSRSLAGKVAVVTGATRHAGQAVAIELGIAGATVYCTGRSTSSARSSRTEPGSIDETAEIVHRFGGTAVPVRVDHTDVAAVEELFNRVVADHGRLDLLINAISGKATNDAFLQSDLVSNLESIWQGGRSHIIATHVAAKKMARNGDGLIISVSDHEWDQFYAIEKAIFNRLAISVGEELRSSGVTMLALLPGAFFHCFGILTAEELAEAVASNPNVAKCHTPRLIGRAVVALAQDGDVALKSGRLCELKELVSEYGLTDIDGRRDGEMW